jgi:hypothetical protein
MARGHLIAVTICAIICPTVSANAETWVDFTRSNMRAVMPPGAECTKNNDMASGDCIYKKDDFEYSISHGMDKIDGIISYPNRDFSVSEEHKPYIKKFGDFWAMYGLDRAAVSACFDNSKQKNTGILAAGKGEDFAKDTLRNKQYALTCWFMLNPNKTRIVIRGFLAPNNQF